jgi:SAM-dependent methyltransferase
MKIYNELAAWWPLFSSPEDYAEEAAFFRETFIHHSLSPLVTLLELGSGGGNNASHLKADFKLTLVDLSPQMLAVSRALNPECEHIEGDMRTVKLERQFDGVFIHDAIMYMTSEADLRMAIETAFVHCKPGGVALLVPDYTRETFTPTTEHGGDDGKEQAIRYLAWTFDPDTTDTTYQTTYAVILRDKEGSVRFEHDEHQEGLFSRETWRRLMTEVGFTVRMVQDNYDRDIFIGKKAQ